MWGGKMIKSHDLPVTFLKLLTFIVKGKIKKKKILTISPMIQTENKFSKFIYGKNPGFCVHFRKETSVSV
jgi:hypothetical protein